jgi:hypothetical protein
MSQNSPLDALVEAGLRALKEQEKIHPAERFERMVRSGLIDERGRLLHQGDDADDGEVPIRELRASLAVG